jgi:hypothetical protein
MYHSNGMEPYQGSTRFIERCWRLLSQDGWLVINLHVLPDPDQSYMTQIHHYFSEVIWSGIESGNYVLFCGKRKLPKPLHEYGAELSLIEARFATKLSAYLDRACSRDASVRLHP